MQTLKRSVYLQFILLWCALHHKSCLSSGDTVKQLLFVQLHYTNSTYRTTIQDNYNICILGWIQISPISILLNFSVCIRLTYRFPNHCDCYNKNRLVLQYQSQKNEQSIKHYSRCSIQFSMQDGRTSCEEEQGIFRRVFLVLSCQCI